MLRRRRLCSDGHKFYTYEIGEQLAKTLDKYASISAKSMIKLNERRLRNKRIVHAVLSGRTIRDVAQEFNLAETTVGGIIEALLPNFDKRSHGLKVAWQTRRKGKTDGSTPTT